MYVDVGAATRDATSAATPPTTTVDSPIAKEATSFHSLLQQIWQTPLFGTFQKWQTLLFGTLQSSWLNAMR